MCQCAGVVIFHSSAFHLVLQFFFLLFIRLPLLLASVFIFVNGVVMICDGVKNKFSWTTILFSICAFFSVPYYIHHTWLRSQRYSSVLAWLRTVHAISTCVVAWKISNANDIFRLWTNVLCILPFRSKTSQNKNCYHFDIFFRFLFAMMTSNLWFQAIFHLRYEQSRNGILHWLTHVDLVWPLCIFYEFILENFAF